MKGGIGLGLVVIGMFLWIAAIFVFSGLTRDVARVAPPKTNRPLLNLLETNDLGRVWREHKRHFPNNRRRKAVAILTVAAALCAYLGFYLSK